MVVKVKTETFLPFVVVDSDDPLGDVEIPLHEIERESTHAEETNATESTEEEGDPKFKWNERWVTLDNVKHGELQVTFRRAAITSPEMKSIVEVRLKKCCGALTVLCLHLEDKS